MTRGRRALLIAAAIALLSPAPARAFPDFLGARGLAMGGAGRADARAEQGPLLNPAGMSLARLYTVEGGYGYINRDGGQAFRGSVVDSTSGFKLGGGLFYGYRTASPVGVPALTGHEVGLSLSYPFGDKVMVGTTSKYVNVSGGAEPDGKAKHSGFTFDAGMVARASMLTIGVVGYNLRDLSSVMAPMALGYGLALQPVPDLTFVVDSYHDFTTYDGTRGTVTTVSGGGEYVVQRRLALRAGGGRDGASRHGFLSAGVSVLAEIGAVDAAVRQDISGDARLTFFAAGLRLFVPAPQP